MRIFSLLSLFLLTGCNLRVLNPKSDTADKITNLIYLSFGLMMLVFVVVMILFVHFLKKYKETPERLNEIPGDGKESKRLEVTWTVLPILLLAVLAVPTVKATYDMTSQVSGDGGEAKAEDAITIDVVGRQYNWEFTYENGKKSVNELVLPVNQKADFKLTSEDVIHSFWVPKLSGKIDVLPGEETRLSFTPREAGVYQGKCAEFCGAEHTQMRFETKVVSQAEFQQWLKNGVEEEGE
ncbi:cytochrome c oxidase subunit II [Halobacillus yeomjeoni]|uniref:cytochrome c oxidase subunit II n=1 Tax=Halobacillus yeomjeoni TaxID=311194 RepID=UPI001CD69D82|nr:cytochrome c oxidase subunit II [Halobacillus yeomjeoni]MCA0985414.1 cytochrome c oxidase subunit II [Halobacillus yeomjeoni]